MTAFTIIWMVTTLVAMTTHHVCCFKLTILHTNNFPARIKEVNKSNKTCTKSESDRNQCYGGVQRLKTKIDEIRATYPNSPTLLLDAGNQYGDPKHFQVHDGGMVAKFMNNFGYDAMSLRTHEFEKGPDGLVSLLKNASFTVLSISEEITKTSTSLFAVSNYATFQFGQEKVSVIGCININYDASTTGCDAGQYECGNSQCISYTGVCDGVKDCDDRADEVECDTIKIIPITERIQQEVNKMRSIEQSNKIIVLGCGQHELDMAIANRVNGIDVIVGGGSGTFLYNGVAPAQERPRGSYPTIVEKANKELVLVVSAYGYGKYLGFLQVEFDSKGNVRAWNGNPILLGPNVPKASLMEKRPKIDTIGMSLVHLEGNESVCSFQECNLGNLITDAMVRSYMRLAGGSAWNHVAIALMNSGGIRRSIPRGGVTEKNVRQVLLPFPHTYDLIELTGIVIWEVLEHSVSTIGKPTFKPGSFLQVSGLRVVYDLRKDTGRRVVMVHAKCTECSIPKFEPLNLTKTYNVLLPSTLEKGGDVYPMISHNVGSSHTLGPSHTDVVLGYFRKYSPISTRLENRIRFMQELEKVAQCANGVDTYPSPLPLILITNFVVSLINI